MGHVSRGQVRWGDLMLASFCRLKLHTHADVRGADASEIDARCVLLDMQAEAVR